jgi:arginase family enzyme
VVDPAFAPGTGTPEVGGFTGGEAVELVRGLKGLNFVGFDVVEVLPAYDPAEITAVLAANIMYEFLSLIALNKKNVGGLQSVVR